ncbi:hypothetical protein, partial [Salmonella enterica subsp. enterica serovar Bredeney]
CLSPLTQGKMGKKCEKTGRKSASMPVLFFSAILLNTSQYYS